MNKAMQFKEWVSDMFDLDIALLSYSEVQDLRKKFNALGDTPTKASKANPKAIATAQTHRAVAKSKGAKALKGTAKQKAWGEQIRKEFLEAITDDKAVSVATQSEITATAKFWIETRHIGIQKLAKAMTDLVVATQKANEIGAGNDGYREQLLIREQALAILTVK